MIQCAQQHCFLADSLHFLGCCGKPADIVDFAGNVLSCFDVDRQENDGMTTIANSAVGDYIAGAEELWQVRKRGIVRCESLLTLTSCRWR
jgi:hypothetical protein